MLVVGVSDVIGGSSSDEPRAQWPAVKAGEETSQYPNASGISYKPMEFTIEDEEVLDSARPCGAATCIEDFLVASDVRSSDPSRHPTHRTYLVDLSCFDDEFDKVVEGPSGPLSLGLALIFLAPLHKRGNRLFVAYPALRRRSMGNHLGRHIK